MIVACNAIPLRVAQLAKAIQIHVVHPTSPMDRIALIVSSNVATEKQLKRKHACNAFAYCPYHPGGGKLELNSSTNILVHMTEGRDLSASPGRVRSEGLCVDALARDLPFACHMCTCQYTLRVAHVPVCRVVVCGRSRAGSPCDAAASKGPGFGRCEMDASAQHTEAPLDSTTCF